jgi:predicted nucleotidyltransferase
MARPAQRARALDRVREIVLEALHGRTARVYVFGSSVTGPVHQASDIDIAVEARGPLPPELLAELRDRLEESDIPYDVDIVDLGTVSPMFRERIQRDGVVWQG